VRVRAYHASGNQISADHFHSEGATTGVGTVNEVQYQCEAGRTFHPCFPFNLQRPAGHRSSPRGIVMRRGPQTNIISTARLRDEPKAWLPKPLGFIIAGVLALVTTAIFCSAQQRTGKSIETPSVSVAISPEAQIVTTQHQVKVGQRIL